MMFKTPLTNSAHGSRFIPGLLLFALYCSNLALPLLHHFEIGSAGQQRMPAAGVVWQPQEQVFTHNQDLCPICQNSYVNQYFQVFRPMLFSGPAPLYREPILNPARRLLVRHEHSGQPRAPPQL
ncbi:MAG: hypothetical protein GX564_12565 [Oligosphaeraceae bacterium]|nr:hypothetical protein [Oligosphaeraceae bacterium]